MIRGCIKRKEKHEAYKTGVNIPRKNYFKNKTSLSFSFYQRVYKDHFLLVDRWPKLTKI